MFLPKEIKSHQPPLKIQGKKLKLIKWIGNNISWNGEGVYYEPFLGSGSVGFNINPNKAVFGDDNPHIIRFYNQVKMGKITPSVVVDFLTEEGKKLSEEGADYYNHVRERFNETGSSLDFLFLSRAGFNGMMRFNLNGRFNVPFCHKPYRYYRNGKASALTTGISYEVKWLQDLMRDKDWRFVCCDWKDLYTLHRPGGNDFVYLDPPYIGRHTDYFNKWDMDDAQLLAKETRKLNCGWALSMWVQVNETQNPHLSDWGDTVLCTQSHTYQVGPTVLNRPFVIEGLLIKPGFQVTVNDNGEKAA